MLVNDFEIQNLLPVLDYLQPGSVS